MLNAYVLNGPGLAPLPADAPLADALWIDLYRPMDTQVAEVATLGITVPTLADMEEIEISNRLYREGQADYMTAVLPGQMPDGTPASMPVTFILTPDRLVTVRHHAPRPFETFPTRAERCTPGTTSADRLFLGLIEEIIARLADLLEAVGRELDRIIAPVLANQPLRSADSFLREALRHMAVQSEIMARVRLGLLTIERILSYCTAAGHERSGQDRMRAVAKGLNRDVQALEIHADFLGGRVQLTMDATMGMINVRQNETVRILSVVAALFMPPTLIASIYGMNFDAMPELHLAWGYPLALVGMLASAVGTFLFLKWKGWM